MDNVYVKTTLDNGLRILTASMPQTRAVSVSVFLGAGSRYESDAEAGASHFIEHVLFKGTAQRASAQEIAEAIEGVGGVLNGATERELTTYWCKVARPHLRLAVDVLADMLLHPKFDPQDIEKERLIIIDELAMVKDSPQQRVDVLIDDLIWPSQPLGRDVAGTKESVMGLTRPMLLDYMVCQYVPSNTVVAIAGDIEHQEVAECVQAVLGGWADGNPRQWYPADDGQREPRLCLETRKTEQAHLCLALRGLPSQHPDRYALDMLSVILGEGMSSRLFLGVRERLGLAYDVHSFVGHYRDSGSLIIYAAVEPQNTAAAVEAVLEELRKLKAVEVPQKEVTKAKELAKGRLLLRMEDSRAVVNWMGVQELLLGRIRTVDEVLSLVDQVTAEDLQRVAQGLFAAEKLSLAIVGPLRGQRRFQGLLKLL